MTIPGSYNAEIYNLISTARQDVVGGLTMYGDSEIDGAFDVEGWTTVNVPDAVPTSGDDPSLLPYLGTSRGLVLQGGGTITGLLTTVLGSQTSILGSQLEILYPLVG